MTEQLAPQQQPTERDNPMLFRIGLVLFVVALIASLIGAAVHGAGVRAAAAAASNGPYTVMIEGVGSADVATDQDGAGEQHTEVTLPYDVSVRTGTRIVSVVAALSGADSGTGISCTVTDATGTVLKTASSSGDNATVSCATALR